MYIKVKVTPGAKKDLVTQRSNDEYEISTRAPAEHNLANRYVCILLAQTLQLSPQSIRIIRGHKQRNKLIEVLK